MLDNDEKVNRKSICHSLPKTVPMLCGFFLVFASLDEAFSADKQCTVTKKAQIQIQENGNRFMGVVELNHKSVMMLIDSGASRAALVPDAGDAMMLYQQQRKITRIDGVGGRIERHPYAASILQFGPVVLLNHDMDAVNISSPNEVRNSSTPLGLIGTDVLSIFDVEFDFPNHTMSFYEVNNCDGRFLPWEGPYQDIQAIKGQGNVFIIPVELNGQVIEALVDTGANISTLGSEAAKRMGLDLKNRTGKVTQFYGAAGRAVNAEQYNIETVQIGNLKFNNIPLFVRSESFANFDMLLGIDFLKGQKVWLSYKTDQVFFQSQKRQ